jgi:hypothetical protein
MMFSAIPKLYVYGAIAAAAVFAFSAFVWSIKRDARNEVIHSIERAENDARRKAVEGARSVDSCYDNGGVWDRSAGACRLPEGQRR